MNLRMNELRFSELDAILQGNQSNAVVINFIDSKFSIDTA